MSVEVIYIESNNGVDQAKEIADYLNLGYEVLSTHITRVYDSVDDRYSEWHHTYMRRDDAKSRVDGSSLREMVDRNSRDLQRIKTRLTVLEQTMDDDTQENDRVYDLAPGGDWRSQIVQEAILEDEAVER